ncbi:MAG TPA: sigma-70 family RNA polymerase sigma factor, partial [Burkholderiaceae bacterium]|nr:sigma-70 family RNA polymerase sigma factor [Burkholderiaceae bacterium]
MSGDAAAAADATHDAFVALATRPSGFDPARGALGAYLAGIARHALLALKRGAFDALDDDHCDDDANAHDSPEDMRVRRQGRDALWRAIRELPWPQREALVLVDLQERPYQQAAAIAGCELNTLRTRLHRARHRLAVLLGASAQESPP